MNLRFIVRDGKKILQRGTMSADSFDQEVYWEDVPCVEEKPKSVTVTREDLAGAWGRMVSKNDEYNFKYFAEELGL